MPPLVKKYLTALAVIVLLSEPFLGPLIARAEAILPNAPATKEPGPLPSEPLDASAATGGYSQIVLPGQGVTPAKPTIEEEIISQRDAYTDVFLEPNGSFKAKRSLTPQNFLKDGQWQKIDTTLLEDSNPTDSPNLLKQLVGAVSASIGRPQTYKVTANDWQARIAPSDASFGMIRVQKDGLNLVIRPVGANIVNPDIQRDAAGNQFVRYSEIWSGVDLEYRVYGSEIKENIVVKNKQARPEFKFQIEGAILEPHPSINGAFAIKGNNDFYITPTIVESPLLGTVTETVTSQSYADGLLTVTLDEVWLKGLPEGALPIVIDPSTKRYINNWYTSFQSDGFVCQSDSCWMNVGTRPFNNQWLHWRTVFHVPYLDLFTGTGYVLTDAKLQLYKSPNNFQVTDSPKWVSSPHASCWGYECKNLALGEPAAQVTTEGRLDLTYIYQYWVERNEAGAAFILFGEEGGYLSQKKFDPNTSYVEFSYERPPPPNNPPPASSLVSPTNGVTVTTLQPTLVTNAVADPDGHQVFYNFRVCMSPDCNDTIIDLDASKNPFVQFTVPEGVLQDGTTYYWRVFTRDENSNWLPSPMVWSFRTDLRNGKDSTQSYDSAGAVTVDLATGNLTTSSGSHALKALGGNIALGLEYNSPARARHGVIAEYWNGFGFDGDPLLRRVEDKIDFDWGENSPDNSLLGGAFSSKFTTYFTAPAGGTYFFGVSSDDDAELIVNRATVVNFTGCCADRLYGAGVNLPIGAVVKIEFRHKDQGGPALAKLWAKGAIQETIIPNQWLRTEPLPLYQKNGVNARYYFDDGSHSFNEGRLILQRREQMVNNNWRQSGPLVGVTDHFLARYQTYFTAPKTSQYIFGAGTDDGARLYVNGALQLDDWVDRSYTRKYGSPVSLTQGQSIPLTLEYYENGGDAVAKMWVKSEFGEQIIPTKWLNPTAQILPNGWELSMDGDGNLAYERIQINTNSVVLYDASGSSHEYKWSVDKNSYLPPVNEAGVLARQANGSVSLLDSDGRVYLFAADGTLKEVTTPIDARNPASLRYEYGDTPPRLKRIIDGVDSSRFGTLYYGSDPFCSAPPAGFDASAPATMICGFGTTDGQVSRFYYRSGQLARLELPGQEVTDWAYDSAGRVSQIRGSLSFDAVTAGWRPAGAELTTEISYDIIGRSSAVTLPAPTSGGFRSTHNYRYQSNSTQTTESGEVEPFGFSQWVHYDPTFRTLKHTDKANLDNWTQWDSIKDLVHASTDEVDLKSTIIYDQSDRPTDSYGPAPAAWFDADRRPLAAYATRTPHLKTGYDEQIRGFGVVYHDYLMAGKTLRGSPKLYGTGLSTDGSGNPIRDFGATPPFTISPDAQGWGVRSTGRVTLPNAGSYVFKIRSDNGARLWLDDRLVIDDWNDGSYRDHPTATFSNPVGGQSVKIRLDYYHLTGGNANIAVYLSGPGIGETTAWGNLLSPDYGLATSTVVYDNQLGNVAINSNYGSNPEFGQVQSATEDVGGLNLTT
ncbi:MAG: PA14 domain-containing protein, partial [Patescibacteria group bacterium]